MSSQSNTEEQNNYERIAMRVSRRCIFSNVALVAFKLFAGIVGQSAAMVSDAVHSLSDICGTAIVMIGVRLSNKRSDKQHQYGHERLECVAAILLAAILFATGAGIGWASLGGVLKGAFNGGSGALAAPGIIALIAATVSIVTKEAMYWYVRGAAKTVNSTALMAEAWHHRSDAFSSIGSFVGILGARLGFPLLDPLAGIVISLLIIKAAIDIFREAVAKMTDRACDDETTEQIRSLIMGHESVEGIDQLKTRLFGNKIYVDVEILLNGAQSLHEAHDIAQDVHDSVERNIPHIKHCMIHVNPATPAPNN
ncbi:MAG: cation diffusion facilitator family transporter [Oscillospiraceae bacterium]|nr:cation diffusion facilitator family transporter [Oscillospiraceae bacterium]